MENGKYLVQRFRETYPDANVTEIKMLDLVLWQTRPSSSVNPTGYMASLLKISASKAVRSSDAVEV